MRLTIVAREHALQRIATDSRTDELMDAVLGRPRLVWLLLTAIREYTTLTQLTAGRGGGAPNLEALIAREEFERRDRNRANLIRRTLHALYGAFDAGAVRGVLLERLAEQQIRSRYGGLHALCENNVKVTLENGASHTTSTSIDVIGFDGTLGECHDCKADAVRFVQDWIDELDGELVPRGFAVGLVTADSKQTAERKLSRVGVSPRRAELVGAAELEQERLPLR